MTHTVVAPILLPLSVGCLLLLARENQIAQRTLSLLSTAALLLIAVMLLRDSTMTIETYRLGNWRPPFGIVLVLDRLAATMLITTAVLAVAVQWYACAGEDRVGRFFHPLFQFQLVGINGAFLTGDLFNLFVFFEILLIASYGLLLHGSNPASDINRHVQIERVGASVQYVVLNLIGSALFLFAAGIFYGVAGTLNFADLARFIATQNHAATTSIEPLLIAATLLLLLVFGLKAAFVPLHFWLPRSYRVASASVAALFAIMSKIGIYALLRLQTSVLSGGNALHDVLIPWLHPIGVATIAIGAIGAFAATALAELTAYLVIVSIGTLTLALALNSSAATTALLYYLMHSTWISAAMFLLAAQIDRPSENGNSARARRLYGGLFLCGAMALIGAPPLSGFIGKLLLLQSAPDDTRVWIWSSVLLSSFAALIVFSRIGTQIFWRIETPIDGAALRPSFNALGATTFLLALGIAMSVGAAPLVDMLSATAQQLFAAQNYMHSVLPSAEPLP